MSNLPEVKLSYRWITEHDQEMERRNPFPPGRTKFNFEKGPIKGPLLQIGYLFEKDEKKYGAAMMIDPLTGNLAGASSRAPSAPPATQVVEKSGGE